MPYVGGWGVSALSALALCGGRLVLACPPTGSAPIFTMFVLTMRVRERRHFTLRPAAM